MVTAVFEGLFALPASSNGVVQIQQEVGGYVARDDGHGFSKINKNKELKRK
jgi:hypothetical protein